MDLANAVNIITPFIARWETFSPVPYLDSGSYAIGYGNHYYEDGSPVTSDDEPITQDRATELLNFVVPQVAAAVAPLVSVDVSDSTMAALIDLGYNWGTGNLAKSKVLQLINSGAPPDQIASQWQTTAVTSQGIPNSNLVARRAAESQLAFSSPAETTIGTVALVLVAAFIVLFIVNTKKSR
jgi:lysozyme